MATFETATSVNVQHLWSTAMVLARLLELRVARLFLVVACSNGEMLTVLQGGVFVVNTPEDISPIAASTPKLRL